MRRITLLRKLWLDRFSRSGAHRNRVKRERNTLASASAVHTGEKNTYRKVKLYMGGKEQRASVHDEPTHAPETLCLLENWEQTVKFVHAIRTSLSKNIRRSPKTDVPLTRKQRRSSVAKIGHYFDFSTIKSISVPVSLMIASEYDRNHQLNGSIPKAVNYDKWDKEVRNTFKNIGFLEMVGNQNRKTTITEFDGGRLLKLCSGETANFESINDKFKELGIDVTVEDPRLFEAISEAITNTVHHAYRHSDLCEPDTVNFWWLVASLERSGDDRTFTIAIYDQGATIPGTLPMWAKYPTVLRLISQIPNLYSEEKVQPDPSDSRFDAQALEIAIQIGRSSSENEHRGKGLDQIVQAVQLCKSGSVSIYSRRGALRHEKNKAPQISNHVTPMVGTLIVWTLVI